MELFDILDESGNVVSRKPRSIVHTKGFIHRSVYFFVFDKNFRILVNQRSDTKEFLPGYWSICLGGHPSSGEGYDEAVAREVPEETGVRNKPFYITDYKNFWLEKDRELSKVYSVMTDDNFQLDKSEIKQAFFLPFEKAKKFLSSKKVLPETDDMIKILEAFLKKKAAGDF